MSEWKPGGHSTGRGLGGCREGLGLPSGPGLCWHPWGHSSLGLWGGWSVSQQPTRHREAGPDRTKTTQRPEQVGVGERETESGGPVCPTSICHSCPTVSFFVTLGSVSAIRRPNRRSEVFSSTWPSTHPSTLQSHRGSQVWVWGQRAHGLEGRTCPPHPKGNITVHSSCLGLFQPGTSQGLQSSWMTTSDHEGPRGHPRPLRPPP